MRGFPIPVSERILQQKTGDQHSMAPLVKLSCLILLCTLLCAPAMAGTKYLSGSPVLSASVSGTNEFSPGDSVDLPVVIENNGINDYKLVQAGVTDPEDMPNTAKYLTAALLPGDAPISVRSDPRMLGDLKGAGRVSTVFPIRIDSHAAGGTYEVPLLLNYSYLSASDQFDDNTMKYTYALQNITLAVPLKIKPDVRVDVMSAVPEHLNAGTAGYVILTLRNSGSENGSRSVVRILRNGNSPILPVDSSVYIGDFPAGNVTECRYKVSVTRDSDRQTYPVDVVVEYQNPDGDTVTSRSATVGIPIGGKPDFAIVSRPAEMNPGNRKTISVEYRNTGDAAVYSAQARISAVDPFTSNDDIEFIGDLMPGESRVVSFTMGVDRSATVKQYGLDSEIRYRDALDNTYISDTMKVNVNVTSPTGIVALVSNPIYLSVLAAVVIGLVYAIFHYRRKK